jgi:hypothetical protein
MISDNQSRLAETSGRKIRVFDIDPGILESPIHGDFREVPLDGSQSYVALSYVCGTDQPSIPIDCGNGTLPVLVTKNCHAALRRLRKTSRKRTLWIDALCINQQDKDERGYQVAMMKDIYSNASRVYIWLGEGTDRSDYALDWCIYASRQGFMLMPEKLRTFSALFWPNELWKHIKVHLENAKNSMSFGELHIRYPDN